MDCIIHICKSILLLIILSIKIHTQVVCCASICSQGRAEGRARGLYDAPPPLNELRGNADQNIKCSQFYWWKYHSRFAQSKYFFKQKLRSSNEVIINSYICLQLNSFWILSKIGNWSGSLFNSRLSFCNGLH